MTGLLRCMLLAAAVYHLPPRVLPVIARLEGGHPGLVRPDSNGTADYGLMQVNSVWLDAIARRARLGRGETRRRLIDDPCFSIAAAAFILRADIDRAGTLMRGIGDYHSATPALNAAYRARALAMASRMFRVK
ncbi:unnamed protein product [Acidocella sp. C78]|uniref:lytic transglycosylase domain-containing protein n=1 Tax=Acidocella sp. C78 TaxID=1671486 RepID=UPI00191B9B4F|nr:lytic transglycosylase domain-containing protein [Acidocella sp. C78]CAG4914638.1 unnamed protein product [Acidocella sp. C78]